jgi:hypothetical protein
MADSKKYEDKSYGYRGMHSESEAAFPVYYGDNKPTRPQRQPNKTIFSKEDLASYNLASIRVLPVSDNPKDDPVFNTNGTYRTNKNTKVTNEYIGFILVQVQEQHNEKYETVPLAGDSFASFFYGSQPSTYTFTGVALNTTQDNWRDSFEILYADYIRGSAAVRNKTIVQLKYDQRIVTGFISSFSQAVEANSQSTSQFQLSVVVTDIHYLNPKSQDRSKIITDFSFEVDLAKALKDTNLANKLLSSDKLNAVRDYSRTGFLVPPPRPPKPRSAKRLVPNCIFKSPYGKDDNTQSDTKEATVSTNIAQETCTGVDARISTINTFNNAKKRLKDATENLKNASTEQAKAKYEAEANQAYADLTDSKDVLKQLDDPESELSKQVQDQTIQELTSDDALVTSIENADSAKRLSINSKAAGDKTYIPVIDAQALLKVESPEAKRSVAQGVLEKAAYNIVGDEKYVGGAEAEEQERELGAAFNLAKQQAEEKSKKRKAQARSDDRDFEVDQ